METVPVPAPGSGRVHHHRPRTPPRPRPGPHPPRTGQADFAQLHPPRGKSTIVAALTVHYRNLREELLHFRANISGRGHTSDGSSRETVHGGLAIAIALAAWHVRAKATWGGRGGGPVA